MDYMKACEETIAALAAPFGPAARIDIELIPVPNQPNGTFNYRATLMRPAGAVVLCADRKTPAQGHARITVMGAVQSLAEVINDVELANHVRAAKRG